jgi:hypothetical protein
MAVVLLQRHTTKQESVIGFKENREGRGVAQAAGEVRFRRVEVEREVRRRRWRRHHHFRYASWGMDHRLKLHLL